LKDFYLTFDDRDTIVMPLINAYDCIFTRLAHVSHPNKGLTFEDLIAKLNILAKQYKEQRTRDTEDEDEINPYINFTNIIERYKVRFHYTNSYPLFDINDFSFNDKLSGTAMIAYLRYCSYNYYEAAAFSLSALLENEENFIENFPRSITALQISISTKYCDEIILNLLFEQGTNLIEYLTNLNEPNDGKNDEGEEKDNNQHWINFNIIKFNGKFFVFIIDSFECNVLHYIQISSSNCLMTDCTI
ncbi:unnamed protein product, partial [Didymodactylos carnosus]